MSTRRFPAVVFSVLGVAGLATGSLVARQQAPNPMPGHDMPMTGVAAATQPHPAPGPALTTAEKIANAMTAGPSSVSAQATVLDWPATEGAVPPVLRQGTNGWNCFPDMPQSPGNDPMCADSAWMAWIDAYVGHKTPKIDRVGVAYMLAPGGAWASNTDPYGMHETSGNHWSHHAPHLMIVVPDPKMLTGLPVDPKNGGPYVMWAGTPYAHIMAPVTAASPVMPPGR